MAAELSLNNVFIAVHMVLARKRMVVHLDMDLNPTVPVRELKRELSNQLSMTPDQQLWYFRNCLLVDEHSLERSGVIHDSIIEVRPLAEAMAQGEPLQQASGTG